MKRLILIGLICLTALIPSSGQTWGVIGLSGTGAGGATCETALWTNTGTPTGDSDINDIDGSKFAGQIFEDTEETRTICKVTCYISWKAGDISTKTYRAYIQNISDTTMRFTPGSGGTQSDNDVVCSATKCGFADAGGEGTAVTFTFGAGVEVPAGDTYAFIVTEIGAADSTNYAEIEYIGSTNNVPGGTAATWSNDGQTVGGISGADCKIIIYGQ